MANTSDLLFEKRDVSDRVEFLKNAIPSALSETRVLVEFCEKEVGSFLIPLKHGNAYEIVFSSPVSYLKTALLDETPERMNAGDCIVGQSKKGLPWREEEVSAEDSSFLCIPETHDQVLIVCLPQNNPLPFSVYEYPILLGNDTDDEWFFCPEAGDVLGEENSWGDYRFTSDELLQSVYEPLRTTYPNYISRMWIGKDQMNRYDMWAYVFEPEDYEQTLFLTAGLHGDEIDAYWALARFLQWVCQNGSTSNHKGLHYLRTKVRLVVVPMVNVFSSFETKHRRNSQYTDLNRDFAEHTQAESVNVIWLLHQFKEETAALIDFHNCGKASPPLYYQFSIEAKNSTACRKVINHIFEELKKRGWEQNPTDLKLIPGAYHKSNVYLQGYAYNHFGIPTLVAEYHKDRWYPIHSAEGFRFAVECFGNHIIQTALAKIKICKKNP